MFLPVLNLHGYGYVISGSKISVRNSKSISFGEELQLDLSGVEQLIEISQTRAISDTLQHIKSLLDSGRCRSKAVMDIAMHIEHELDAQVSQSDVLK